MLVQVKYSEGGHPIFKGLPQFAIKTLKSRFPNEFILKMFASAM